MRVVKRGHKNIGMKINFWSAISNSFPKDFCSRDAQILETYGRDWTTVFDPKPSAVVFPRQTDEVASFLKLCLSFGVAVVPSGGRTGLAGGAVAKNGEIVVSLERMNKVGSVDTMAQTVRVQAGAVTQAVHEHCMQAGLTWPVDFASKGSSQIGGNIATNAGGVRVIKYGSTRNWVLGLQIVTMAGDIFELNGSLEKNNTGVDLKQLFIGSEGTLGIITEATLKLTTALVERDVFFFALKDTPAVLRLFYEARKAPIELHAFEMFTDGCLDAVIKIMALKPPFVESAGKAYVLMEIKKDGQGVEEWLAGLFKDGLIMNGIMAQSEREARDLWALRENIAESLYRTAFLHKNDIAVPVADLDGFVSEMEDMFRKHYAKLDLYFFGHIGDGNLHINTLKPSNLNKDDFLLACHETDKDLFSLVQKFKGSVSAEHGIGLLKKDSLHYSRSAVEMEIMRKIKKVFDPQGLMNPGKIFD